MAPKASKNKEEDEYKLPDKIPEGTILTTIAKKQFRVGKSIGVGGFGEIYLCGEDITRPVGDDALKAVKIEPHSNGPLFVEMNFYIRAASTDSVSEFMQKKNLTSLGMPVFRGSGSTIIQDEKYRFLIMDRFGNDLQKIFQSGKKLFSSKVTYNLALKILNVLEYIHSKGYVHNDIKAQNLLLGYGRTKENEVYLVDFGLVSKYHRDGVHLEFRPDARKAHDGTIEYTSRDAHSGAHSRRSDLEILGYNLVHWMSGYLPWMDNLANEEYVEAQKKGFMTDVKSFVQRCFGDKEAPEALIEFLKYTNSLEFDSTPDYDRCRSIFVDALVKEKHPLDGKIDFTAPKAPVKSNKKSKKRKRNLSEEPDAKKPNNRANLQQPTPSASPSPDINDFGALTRSGGNSEDMDNWSWERVLCSDPEMLIRQASRQSETDDESPLALQHRVLDEKKQTESLSNPTPIMLEVLQRMEDREKERENMTWQQQLQHLTGRKNSRPPSTWDLTPNPLTPAMEEVIKMRSKRISVEIDIPITPEPSESEDSEDDNSSHEEYVPSSLVKKKSPPGNGNAKKSPTGNDRLPSSSSFRRRPVIQPEFVPDSILETVDNSVHQPQHQEIDDIAQMSQVEESEDDEVIVKSQIPKQRKRNTTNAPSSNRNMAAAATSTKRRAIVPHVVRVQNLPYSPDRIRNKGSPVKPSSNATSQAAVAAKISSAAKMDLSEKLISSMSAEETRSQIAELNRFANKRRRISNFSSDLRNPPDPLPTSTAAAEEPVPNGKKGNKRKLEEEKEEVVEKSKEEFSLKFVAKKTKLNHYIMVPSPNKNSVTENVAKTVLKKKSKGPRFASSPQRLSSIPVEVCIETLGSSSNPQQPQPQPLKKGKGRPPKVLAKRSLLIDRAKKRNGAKISKERVEHESEDKVAPPAPKKSDHVEPETQVAPKKGRSTRSKNLRSTRSMDWEKILLTNPDKVSKRK